MVDKTGGVMVMSDSFAMHVFKQSLTRLFDPDQEGYLSMGFNARIEVVTSRDCRVNFFFSLILTVHTKNQTILKLL